MWKLHGYFISIIWINRLIICDYSVIWIIRVSPECEPSMFFDVYVFWWPTYIRNVNRSDRCSLFSTIVFNLSLYCRCHNQWHWGPLGTCKKVHGWKECGRFQSASEFVCVYVVLMVSWYVRWRSFPQDFTGHYWKLSPVKYMCLFI